MNLEELKSAWQEYDTKLQSTQALNDRLINSIIKERSSSRLSRVKSQYVYGLFYMCGWIALGLAVLIGNPFDYTRKIEFLPIVIYCLCLLILVFLMLRSFRQLDSIEIAPDNLDNALKKIISFYEQPKQFSTWTLRIILFSSTILFPLSFLPRKIEKMGLWGGLIDTLIPIAISATLVFIAHKFGAFKDRQEGKFRQDLEELNRLKGFLEE